jgi:hypothetical protein
VTGRKWAARHNKKWQKGSTLMLYRVSLESGVDEAIEEVDCEDWAVVHAVLDKWHSQVLPVAAIS